MFLNIIILVAGFVILIKGADVFVDSSSSVAQNFKVSKMLIGLTIVAFGTSAPELAVSISAMLKGSGDMVLGNVIGSNIINALLILGTASIIRNIRVQNNTVKKEIPFLVLITILLSSLMADNLFNSKVIPQITRIDGFIIILFFLIFIYYIIGQARNKTDDDGEKPKYSLGLSFLFVILSLGAIILGSQLVVNSATNIAKEMGVSERIISLTVIALGTSLPELVTSIVAALKRETDLLMGNIIGSNIFNIAIVLGVPVLLFGDIIVSNFSRIDLVAFILSSILLFIFSFKDHKITKKEGILMLVIFVIYYASLFM